MKRIEKLIEYMEQQENEHNYFVVTDKLAKKFNTNMVQVSNELRLYNYSATYEDHKSRLVVVKKKIT